MVWKSGHPGKAWALPKSRVYSDIRSHAILGIDLGTTNSSVAIIGEEGPKVISDEFGNRQVPSVVVITDVRYIIPGHNIAV